MKNEILVPVAVLVLFAATSAAVAQSAAPVAVTTPTEAPATQSMELTGSFVARRSARLSPRIAGLVAEVAVDAGDRVAAGEVLVRLDDRLAELEVAQAKAAVKEARAALSEAKRLRDEGRRLVRDRFLPESEVQSREAAVLMAEAAVAVSESEAATVSERLARHTVIAPFDGVVSRKLTEAGEWASTGVPVAELVGTDELWLDVRAPQESWPALADRAEVAVRADAFPNRPLEATVHARVPVNDPTARTFLVRLVISDPPPGVIPGMSARARFLLPRGGKVLNLPRDAIIRYPDGTTTVWIVTDGKARESEVTVDRFVGDIAEISAGVGAGQQVVVRGNEVLTENQSVRIVDNP